MKLVGHKTESIYKRYSIVDHSMLILGADRLDLAQKRQVAELERKAAESGAGAGVVH